MDWVVNRKREVCIFFLPFFLFSSNFCIVYELGASAQIKESLRMFLFMI